MTNDKDNYTKHPVAKASLAPKRHLIHEVVSDPFLDWFLIATFTFIVLLALVAMGIYVYLDAGSRLSAPPAEITKNPTPIDSKVLETVLNDFDSKAAERAVLVKDYVPPRDPSLP